MLSIIGIAPHPPIIIPQIGRGDTNRVEQTINGMKLLSRKFKENNIQSLIVITPHGPIMRGGPAISTAQQLSGNFGQFGSAGIEVQFSTDQKLLELVKEETANEPVRPVFSDDGRKDYEDDETLDHGAMVPLYYLHQQGVLAPGLYVTIGFQPYHELFEFGHSLRRAIDRRDLPVAVLASGDLSHRLTATAPAGYSLRGAEFDRLLVDYIQGGQVEEILNFDPKLVEEAGECGLRSIIIALGILGEQSFESEVLSYEGPFGVGYMVAVLFPGMSSAGDANNSKKIAEETADTTVEPKAAENELFNPAGLARATLEKYFKEGRLPKPEDPLPAGYSQQAGVFVSLKIEGKLRGCIGTVEPVRENLAEEIIANTIGAAFKDPRFPAVSSEEFPDLQFSVDVLSPMERVNSEAELDHKKYGVMVRRGGRSGLLLPDLDSVNSVQAQINIAKQKAGILPDEPADLYRFTVTRYGE